MRSIEAEEVEIKLIRVNNSDDWAGDVYINNVPTKQVSVKKLQSKFEKDTVWYPVSIKNADKDIWDKAGKIRFWTRDDGIELAFCDPIILIFSDTEKLCYPSSGIVETDKITLTFNVKQFRKNQEPDYKYKKDYIISTEDFQKQKHDTKWNNEVPF